MSQPPHGLRPAQSSPTDVPSARDAGATERARPPSATEAAQAQERDRPRSHLGQLPSLATLTGTYPDSRPLRASGMHTILNDPSEPLRSITSPRTASDDSAISPLTRPGEQQHRAYGGELRTREPSPATRGGTRDPGHGSSHDPYRPSNAPSIPTADFRNTAGGGELRRQSGSPYRSSGYEARSGGSGEYITGAAPYRETRTPTSRSSVSPYATRAVPATFAQLHPISTSTSEPPYRGPTTSSPYSATHSAGALSSASFHRQAGSGPMPPSGVEGGLPERSSLHHISEGSSIGGGSFAYAQSAGGGSTGIHFPIDVQAASKVADEKRRRNAGASARFRARRKEKEQANSREIDDLRSRIRELEEDAEFYRRERDYFVAHLYNAPDRDHHFPRPPSPRRIRMQRVQAGLPASSISYGPPGSPVSYQELGERGADGRALRRRLTGEYASDPAAPSSGRPEHPTQSSTLPSTSYAPPPYGSTPRYGGPPTPGQSGPSGTPTAGPGSEASYFSGAPGQGYGVPAQYTLPPPQSQHARNQHGVHGPHPPPYHGSGSENTPSNWPPRPPSR